MKTITKKGVEVNNSNVEKILFLQMLDRMVEEEDRNVRLEHNIDMFVFLVRKGFITKEDYDKYKYIKESIEKGELI